MGRQPKQLAETPTTPDAIEIAMEADVTGRAPGAEAVAVLRKQSALFDEQIGLARNERFRNRIKAVRDMALSAAVLALIGSAGVVLWNAHQASGLVVEAFQTPPDMAANGLDGPVVAARLLDRLSAMQAGTDSSRAPATFGNNWGDDLAVELPETGRSAGEVWRMLRQTLGEETRLSGDLTRAEDGTLTLTTRVGANPGVAVTGGPEEMDRLLDESAQAVYRQAQPYRYAVWLSREGGREDGPILAELAASSDKTERLWALVGQSVNALPADPLEAVALAREALNLDPSFQKARWNLTDAYGALGWSEADLHEAQALSDILNRRDPRVTKASQDQVLYGMRALVASYLYDNATLLENARTAASLPSYSQNAERARYAVAWAHLGLHDLGAARSALATANRTSPVPAMSGFMGAALAAETSDSAPVVALAQQVQAAGLAALSAPDRAGIARMLAEVGDLAGAEALTVGGRDDCYPCTVARARIAVLKGDRSAAIRLFRHATGLGPSLPEAWQEWGRARLAWGNVEGARLAFQQAHRRGPRWADPLKYEGDALLAAGDARGAERRYRNGAERAPKWGALHIGWGRALEALGRREDALAKYRAAVAMDLTPIERAEAQRRITGAGR